MTNQKLLKASIESLKGFRTELHNDIDNSKRIELEEIIRNLECCEGQQISPNQMLHFLGKALAILPILERIFDELNK